MRQIRAFVLVTIWTVFALSASAWARSVETEVVDLELPDQWSFTEEAPGPGSVLYSEMVYTFKNNPGPMAAFTVVRGCDFIIAFTIEEAAMDMLRTTLKSAKWK